MTIAEVHGKIGRTGANLQDQMEDLLTSDIFGACKYVRPATLLLPFLRTAVNQKGISLQSNLIGNFKSVEYHFWPRLDQCEPDLLLILHKQDDKHIVILIEAKYYSSKSGGRFDPDELEIAQAPSDQLAREYLDMMNVHTKLGLKGDNIQYRCLVYLTAHRLYPQVSIQKSLIEITHFVPDQDINLFWTNWFNLYPLITDQHGVLAWEKPIIEDLQLLLERKRLVTFHGFRPIEPVSIIHLQNIYLSQIHPKQRKQYWEVSVVPPLESFYKKRIT